MTLARKDTTYAFLKVNYQWQVYARTTTQGNSVNFLLTLLVPALTAPAP
jgi:hypothetical protein